MNSNNMLFYFLKMSNAHFFLTENKKEYTKHELKTHV